MSARQTKNGRWFATLVLIISLALSAPAWAQDSASQDSLADTWGKAMDAAADALGKTLDEALSKAAEAAADALGEATNALGSEAGPRRWRP